MDPRPTCLFASSLKPYNFLKKCGQPFIDRVTMFAQHCFPFGDIYIIAVLDNGKVVRIFPTYSKDKYKYCLKSLTFKKLVDMKRFHHGHVFLEDSGKIHFFIDRFYYKYMRVDLPGRYIPVELFFNSHHEVVSIQTSSHIMLILTKSGQVWLFMDNYREWWQEYQDGLFYFRILKSKTVVHIACSNSHLLAYTQDGDLLYYHIDLLIMFRDDHLNLDAKNLAYLFNVYDIRKLCKVIPIRQKVIKIVAGIRMAFVLLESYTLMVYDLSNFYDESPNPNPQPCRTIENVYDALSYRDTLVYESSIEGIFYCSRDFLTCDDGLGKPKRLQTDSLADAYAELCCGYHLPFLVNIELAKAKPWPVIDMANHFNTPKNYDLKIFVGDQCIYAHRWYLSRCCEFFEVFLNTSVGNQQRNCVRLHHVDYETVLAFLKFLYTGRIECASLNRLIDLILFADHSMEKRLVQSCSNLMLQWLNSENYQKIYDFSLHFHLKDLQELIPFFCTKFGLNLNQSKFLLSAL